MYAYGQELIAAKRHEPGDDMLSVVVNSADAETCPTLGLELYLFFNLLFSAGAETTRNAIAGGLLALVENPDAVRRRCVQDPVVLPTAIEEMVRWTSPSPSKRRTVTRRRDAGRPRPSNRARRCWCGRARPTATRRCSTDPDRFDIARKPNPHLGFGQGVHYCLGRQPGPAGAAGDLRGDAAPLRVGAR